MTAKVTDILTASQRRQREAMHFRSAPEALSFAANQLDHLRAQLDGQLVVLTDDVRLPIEQTAAIVAECLRLHQRHEGVGQ